MTDKTELKLMLVPIGWFTDDHLTDKSATTYDKAVADRWCEKGWPVQALYDGAAVRALSFENEALTARINDMHADRVEAVAEIVVQGLEADQLQAAIATPESVFINLKAGKIPKPSLRSMIDLYGEVINGEDAQLLEIAKLRAENEALRKELDACHPFKPFHEPAIGFTGCLICGVYTDHGGLPCPKMRAAAIALSMENQRITPMEPLRVPHPLDAAMGKGELS